MEYEADNLEFRAFVLEHSDEIFKVLNDSHPAHKNTRYGKHRYMLTMVVELKPKPQDKMFRQRLYEFDLSCLKTFDEIPYNYWRCLDGLTQEEEDKLIGDLKQLEGEIDSVKP